MARRKRTSIILEKAERRAAGMNSISPMLDMGHGMTLPSFWADIENLRDKQQRYNQLLSSVDQLYNELMAQETVVTEKAENMLNAVAIVYGRDSSEYEMAGGKRRSERKRPSRKTQSEASAA